MNDQKKATRNGASSPDWAALNKLPTNKVEILLPHAVDTLHLDFYIKQSLPFNVAVKSIKVEYSIVDEATREVTCDACRSEIFKHYEAKSMAYRKMHEKQKQAIKRHDAAVKANATRKAKKGGEA